MKKILVTGAEGFLGYHVIKLLNERNIQPRALVNKDVQDNDLKDKFGFENLKVEEILKGSIGDLPFLQKACEGMDTVFHLKFQISLGGGKEAEEQMEQVNVVGTRNVLKAATEARVERLVVSSSSLTVGLNREPQPLDETSDWATHQFNLPYALSRRKAEQEVLAAEAVTDRPVVVVVNPSFTMGPDDYIGAPANQLVKLLSKGQFRFNVPVGFGILDVRDYADGALRAAERGRHGQRYLLSGANVTSEQLVKAVADVCGFQPPGWLIPIPIWVISPLVTILGLLSKVRGKPPLVTSSILELWNRYAWYDTELAQKELGWKPRSLRDTIDDSLRWLRENEKG